MKPILELPDDIEWVPLPDNSEEEYKEFVERTIEEIIRKTLVRN